jgi:NADH-quinone oxidoreductase subunit G
VIQAAANVAAALQRTGRSPRLSLTVPECNSFGAAFFDGGPLEAALDAVRKGTADTVIVAENDLFRRMDAARAGELLSAAKHVIVLDHLQSAMTERAEVVLSAATFAEASGTLVNNEGRAQRFFQVFVPQGDVHPSWRWLGEIAAVVKGLHSSPWPDLDAILAAMAQAMPALKEVPGIAPLATFRLYGQKIARESHRVSGRTAETAHLDIHEPKPPDDPDAPMAFSMEGYTAEPPSSLVPRFWAPAWNSYQAVNKFQIEVGGPLHGGDPGRRLLAGAAESKAPYFAAVPAAFVPRAGDWLILPAHHVFGSDELSLLSPGVAGLAPKPYLAMNAQDAARLGLKEGQVVTLKGSDAFSGRSEKGSDPFVLSLRIRPALPSGVAAVPAGLAGMPVLALPMWGRVSAANV